MLRSIFSFLLIFLSISLSALENKFNYLTPEDGLSQGNITCIYQDSKGFMWFGSFNGLNRYDGYKIKVYNHKIDDALSLSNEYIKYICEDNEHKLWIGANIGGICIFSPQTGIFRTIREVIVGSKKVIIGVPAGIVNAPDGNMWVVDDLHGLYIFDVNLRLIKAYLHDAGNIKFPLNLIFNSITFDKDKTCWIGAGNGTLCKLNEQTDDFEFFTFDNRKTETGDNIFVVFADKKGKIWIGTNSHGVYLFDPQTKSIKNYRKESGDYLLTSNTVRSICEDWDGNILIGTDGGGVDIINPESSKIETIMYYLGNPQSLSSNGVYSIFIDRTGTIWIGTYSGGVNYASKYRYKFKNYKPDPLRQDGLSYKNVKCILQDSNDDIWLGTDGGGLNKFNPIEGTFKHYHADPAKRNWLQTDVIIHMMQDNEGDIFMGSYGHGLEIFNKETEIFKQFLPDESNPNSLAGMNPWYILQDSYGIIWVGFIRVGLDRFDKATGIFKHYKYSLTDTTALKSPNIKVIYEDKERELWFGTEGGGLHKYNRGKDNFTRYFNQPDNLRSLSNDDVRAIYEDKKGRLWIGTGMGLNVMVRDSGIFNLISVKDGLPGNTINGILEDNNGNLWMSTDKGISRFNPDKMTFRNYDITDGLQGNEFNYTASIQTRSGDFYFGGINGFNVFNPDEIKDNPYKPAVVLNDIQIFNKPIEKLKVKVNGKKAFRTIAELDEIKISYKESVISFEFSALDFVNPSKNMYKYKLEGFDKDWTEVPASKRYATYTNLNGGEYVFRVIASNSDAVWNNDGLSIKLIVTPPFWKRAWFIILVIIVIAYFAYNYYRERQTKIERDKKILEEKIKDGLVEVEKQKSELAKKDKELELKIASEKEHNWLNTGMSRFSSLISKNKDNLEILSRSIIVEFIEYLEVAQGALYLYNDDDENDPYLILIACYAPDEDRLRGRRIELKEGEIGACFSESKVIRIDNLPKGYANLSSGLGESYLQSLVVVPLKLNEIVIGVIELISFHPIDDFKVSFIEKVGETLTSLLTALRANEKTNKMLEHQKMQAEEFAAQEEELRQNLEELLATKEEADRHAEELRIISKESEDQQKMLLGEIEKLKIENKKLAGKK